MATLTLNQIVKRLETLALSHDQINHFYFGEVHEFDAEDISYPACFLEMQPSVVNRAGHLTTYNFRVYFLDLVKVSEGTEENETEVLSDMAAVMQDFLAMIMYHEYQDTWMIGDSVNFVPVTEVLNDMDAGVVADIAVSVEFLADRCQVPADNVDFDNTFDMSRTKIVTYDATGSEGNSWNVPVIAGKIVIAAYRAGQYKRILITTPDSEEIQLGGTVLDDDRGIAATGVVTLQTDDQPISDEKFDFLIYD